MYNNYESPTIRIDLNKSDNAIYLKNIESILETPYADRVYFCGGYVESGFVNEIAQRYPNKEFYVSYKSNIGNTINLNNYQFISMCEVTKIKELFSNIVILNIDISENVNAFEIEFLNCLMREHPQTLILQLTSTKIIRNLDFRSFIYKIESFDFDFYFDGLIKPISAIKEHPCNAYLCNREKCHSGKGNFPRYLHVTNKGILPYSAKINDIVFLKNIAAESINFEEYLEDKYNNSLEHNLFIDINRKLFQEYAINPIFKYLPWNIFMEKIYNDEY